MQNAIFLDWYNTLSENTFWEHWLEDETRRSHYQQIQRFLFNDNGRLVNDWMRGLHSSEDIAEYVAKNVGLTTEEALNDLKLSSRQQTLVEPEILVLVGRAKKLGYTVGIATDNMDSFSRWTVPSLKLDRHFDVILNSANLGALKSDRQSDGSLKFFKEFMYQNALDPEDVVLIDDSLHLEPILLEEGIDFRRVTKTQSAADHLEKILKRTLIY